MAEFKFVQWGKGVPVDYQRLGAMMLNEQHLKDKIDTTPRGALLWKQTGPLTSVNPNGGYQSVPTFTSLSFEAEAGRLISFAFNAGLIYADLPCQLRFRFVIDTTTTADSGGGGVAVAGGGYFGASAFHISTTALSKGTHTVSVELVADAQVTSLLLGNASSVSLIVRDEGAFFSQSA